MRLLVGCPVRDRNWIRIVTGVDLEFVFVVAEDDLDSREFLRVKKSQEFYDGLDYTSRDVVIKLVRRGLMLAYDRVDEWLVVTRTSLRWSITILCLLRKLTNSRLLNIVGLASSARLLSPIRKKTRTRVKLPSSS